MLRHFLKKFSEIAITTALEGLLWDRFGCEIMYFKISDSLQTHDNNHL